MNMLSVIVPARDEEIAIGGVLEDLAAVLKKHVARFEIIVVDDGSVDNTADMVRREGSARLIQHPYSRGYGAALKAGIAHASGDMVLTFDADGSYRARDVPRLLEAAENYDMVVGSRTGKVAEILWYRKPAKWLLTRLANYLSRTKIPDLNSGLRLFAKQDIERFWNILPSSFSFTTTLTMAYLCNEYLVKYVPVDCFKGTGKSKIRPWHDGLNFVLLILRVITYFNPLRIFLPLAFSLLLLAVIVLVVSILLIGKILDATVVALFLAAIQTGAMGLLADAIAKRKGE
jgi:glycosyltransferase involved in cell wall biosynthesis